MPFSDVAGEIQLPAPTGMALSEILSMKLEEGGFLTLPRERMGELLDAIGAPSSPFLDKDLLRSAGTRLGISTVVRGNYYFDDTAWRLSVRLIDTESGLIYSTFESNAPTEGLVAAVDEIALRICSSLNVSVSETAQERMGRHGSTVPEALREFGKGVNYHKGILSTPVLERSARHYARAIEADSSFELARYYYALVYDILGLPPPETVSDTEAVDMPEIEEAPPDTAAEKEIPTIEIVRPTRAPDTSSMDRDTVSSSPKKAPAATRDTMIDVGAEGEALYRVYYSDGTLKEEAHMKEGKRDGTTTHYYPDGSLMATIPYVRDRPHGESKLWYPDGMLKAEVRYRQGRRHGKSAVYFRDGVTRLLVHFNRGRPEGEAQTRFEDGTLRRATVYRRGRIQEVARFFYPSGTVRAELSYADDEPDGVSKLYYPSGALRQKVTLHEGIRNGEALSYYPDSQLHRRSTYREGNLHGTVKTFFENGQVQSVQHYREGVLHGWSEHYYPNGNTKWRGTFDHGVKVGIHKHFTPEGAPRYRDRYVRGVRKKRVHLDPDEKADRTSTAEKR